MKNLPIYLLSAWLIVLPSLANNTAERGNELAAIIQARLDNPEALNEILDQIQDDSPKLITPLSKALEKPWQERRADYLEDFDRVAKAYGKQLTRGDNRNLIRSHRKAFFAVYQLGEKPMKPKLKEISWPAVEDLKKLLVPQLEQILKSSPELQEKRRKLIALGKFYLELQTIAIIANDGTTGIEELEQQQVQKLTELDRKGLKIIEKNRKVAKDKKVPEKEALGCEQANLWRMLVGLNALTLDPKLCEAARNHSKDMEDRGFFAHDSPVPGRETPWKRAAEVGTSASGENIYMGSQSYESANKGWFFSPGHHKNFFKTGHTRIGLGQHNSHWTQLFGN